jgi:hypothetical protein
MRIPNPFLSSSWHVEPFKVYEEHPTTDGRKLIRSWTDETHLARVLRARNPGGSYIGAGTLRTVNPNAKATRLRVA